MELGGSLACTRCHEGGSEVSGWVLGLQAPLEVEALELGTRFPHLSKVRILKGGLDQETLVREFSSIVMLMLPLFLHCVPSEQAPYLLVALVLTCCLHFGENKAGDWLSVGSLYSGALL